MDKSILDYVEFHITNICNFNCPNCSRFSNYQFSGYEKWKDYADAYKEWSNKIDILKFSILGGEPMMNPDYLLWIENIVNLWPNAQGIFVTNGYYFKPENRELYNILKKNPRCMLGISLHNINEVESTLKTAKKFLVEPIQQIRYFDNSTGQLDYTHYWKSSYNNIRGDDWPDCDSIDDWVNLPQVIQDECITNFNFSPELLADKSLNYRLIDANGVTVELEHATLFHQSSLIQTSLQSFRLHDSDPVKAHNNCDAKKCHQFYKGKLHKCFITSLVPDFSQQYLVTMSDADEKLINSYQALSFDDSQEKIQQFFSNLKEMIPQCKFCPENRTSKTIAAEHGKKIKIVKKKYL
jgi:uncharacterized Fe-S cluster-containing radical SAM superfamily protein